MISIVKPAVKKKKSGVVTGREDEDEAQATKDVAEMRNQRLVHGVFLLSLFLSPLFCSRVLLLWLFVAESACTLYKSIAVVLWMPS